MKISHFFIRAALVALSLGGLKVLGQGYSLVDLGTGAASDINNSGHVVGTTGANLAFFYDGVSVKNLPVVIFPAGSFGEGTPAAFADSSQANAINDSDVVVASGRLSTASSIGVDGHVSNRYQVGAGPGSALLFTLYSPVAMNNSGVIVGTTPGGSYGDFTWGMWDLNPELPYNDPARFVYFDGGYSRPGAINDAGLVVGSAAVQYGQSSGTLHPLPNLVRACIFRTNGVVEYIDARDPGTTVVDPNLPASHLSDAYGVNAAGHIVGDMSLTPGSTSKHAFRYIGTGLQDLGTLGGSTSSAYDINSSDQIVGTSQAASGGAHAFVWQNGVMTDLNTLLPIGSSWVLQRAYAINNRGEIVGSGAVGGVVHAFLLAPPNVAPALSILVPPVGATVAAGQSYTLSVTAQGGEPLTYQWQHAGTNVPGATQSTYTIARATPDDAGSYLVTVRNAAGNTVSAGAEIIVQNVHLTAGNFLGLTLEGVVGATYNIDYRPSVDVTTWTTLATLTLTNATQVYIDFDSPSHAQRLYRAVLQP